VTSRAWAWTAGTLGTILLYLLVFIYFWTIYLFGG
jgi:hypothetical protein